MPLDLDGLYLEGVADGKAQAAAEIERLTRLNSELLKHDGDAEAVCNSYATENQQLSDRAERAERERDDAIADRDRLMGILDFVDAANKLTNETNKGGPDDL